MTAALALRDAAIEAELILSFADAMEANGDEVPEELIPVFEARMENLRASTDKRISYLQSIENVLARIVAELECLTKLKNRVEKLEQRVVERTIETIQAHSHLEFRGTFKKLAVQKNGGAIPVHWHVELGTLKSILEVSYCKLLPDEFVETVTVPVLKKSLFEEAIRNGVFTCPLASRGTRGVHLRIK